MVREWNRVVARMTVVMLFASVVMPVICLQQVQNARAWKPEQHVPIGVTAIDDLLEDNLGLVEIDGVDYPANPLAFGAIKLFPEYYLMGCIGPDAYPDILYGQCFIHPDNTDLMKTSGTSYSYQWIDHLMNRAINLYYAGDYDTSMKAIAFTYGFMTHYAGDMFGHTYINNLAGGPWDLDLRGYDNALRHMAIESFIHQKTNWDGGPWCLERNPFAYPRIPVDTNDGKMRDVSDYLNDVYFHEFLLDVFYRDPKAISMFEGTTGNSGYWADLWQLIIGIEEKVDGYIAELDKPIEERVWWAKPSPIYDVLKKYFSDWRELIEDGLLEWIKTSSMIAIELFIAQSADAAFTQLKTWVNNYLKGILMGPLVKAILDFVGGMKKWFEILQVGLTLGFSLVWDYFMDWVKDETVELIVTKIFEWKTGIAWDDFKTAITDPVHLFVADEHQNQWGPGAGSPYTGEGTMVTIMYDMNLSVPDDFTGFDPMKFPPTHNSIVMSKLLLMDGLGLNTLLHNYGVKDKYLDISPTEMKDLHQPKSNIMFGQMKSLDADHQWMKDAPNSYEAQPGGASWGEGMPLWTDSDAREKCFKKIFHMGTEVTFDKLKVATRWNVDTTLNLTITNNAYREDQFIVTVSHEGFGEFNGYPSAGKWIKPGETVPYTVHFICPQIGDRDYAGGKITVKVTPQTAGDDPYNLYGNEASCIVVAFPTNNRVFWLDLDEPVELTYDDSLECPGVQPFVPNPELRPRSIWDPINKTLGALPLWRGEPSAYISSRTHMRLYGFSEEGGSFDSMSVRYSSTKHYGMDVLGQWGFSQCPDYKQSPWIDLQVKEVNFVDVGYQSGHVITKSPTLKVYARVAFFSSSFAQDPHAYYFNFDQMMAAENATGPIEWTDDVYKIEYTGVTDQNVIYTDSFVVYLDNTAPKTTIHLDKVQDLAADPIVITPDCNISFTASDGRGSGVEGTFYKIVRNMTVVNEVVSAGEGARQMANDSRAVVPWTPYTGTFNFSELIESGHSGDVYDILWYSYDGVSNMEKKNALRFALVYDDSPPSTSLSIGIPSVSATQAMAEAYVTDKTSMTISATDNYEPLDPDLTGVVATKYRILSDEYDSGWLAYNGPFTLSEVPDGFCHIDYMSTDRSLNAETMKRKEVILDTTPPSTEVSASGPSRASQVGYYVEPSAILSLIAVDSGSGASSTEYRIFGPDNDTGWRPYASPFALSEFSLGNYVLEYRSSDIMSNTEQNRSMQLSIVADNVLSSYSYSVSGCIREQDTDTPIVGATVRSGNFSCETNETGYYSLLIANGTYDVSVSADGYHTRDVTVIVSGEDVIRDIGLAASGGGGAGTSNISLPTAGIIILAVVILVALLSFLALSRTGRWRSPGEPPPPEP